MHPGRTNVFLELFRSDVGRNVLSLCDVTTLHALRQTCRSGRMAVESFTTQVGLPNSVFSKFCEPQSSLISITLFLSSSL